MSAISWILYAQFLVVIFFGTWGTGMLAKTHAKAAQTKVRVDALIAVAKTANQVAPLASNATFLGGLNAIGGITTNGTLPGTDYPGLPGTFGSLGAAQSYCTALAEDVQAIYDYVVDSADNFNGLVSSMASSGFT